MFISLTLCGCGGSGATDRTSQESFDTAKTTAEARVSRDYAGSAQAHGAIVEVKTPQGTWVQAFGDADAQGTPMTPDMQFRIGSVTKTFTSMAILRLVDRLSLDPAARLSRYVANPDPSRYPDWGDITLEHLAHHTSGIVDNYPGGGLSHSSSYVPAELIQYGKQVNIAGAHYQYANTNYVLLGMVIEKANPGTYHYFITSEFLNAIPLSKTVVPTSGSNPPLVCHGFRGQDDVTLEDPSWAAAAGEMVSNVTDLTTWIRTICQPGSLSPQGHLLLLSSSGLSGVTEYGLQEFGGWLGHTGEIDGYSCACFYLPSAEASIVVMVNRSDAAEQRDVLLLNDVVDAFFPANPTGLPSPKL